MKVEWYSAAREQAWNAFLGASKNGTFLFDRRYMEYHADRFPDASLMVFRDDSLVALLPANRLGNTLQSHGGLTFGGLILGRQMTTPRYLEVLAAVMTHLKEAGIDRVEYKPVPTIYHQYPAEEDRYALFLIDAQCYRRDVTSVILPGRRLPLRKGRKSEISKARRLGVVAEATDRWAEFWEILMENLRRKHDVAPAHTVDEIRLLQSRFPGNIHLFTASVNGRMQAGTVIYETPCVAHTQYIGCSQEGQESGALDFLLAQLIEQVYQDKPFFNFGISNENNGRFLNQGLIEFKEGFGARSIASDAYVFNPREVNLAALQADLRS